MRDSMLIDVFEPPGDDDPGTYSVAGYKLTKCARGGESVVYLQFKFRNSEKVSPDIYVLSKTAARALGDALSTASGIPPLQPQSLPGENDE